MDFFGRIYSPQKTTFSQLFFPVAQIKHMFQNFYDLLLQTMWRELRSGKTIDNEYVNLFLFVVFCFLSLLVYYLRDYRQLILITFFVLWFLDVAISKNDCQQNRAFSSVFLTVREETIQIVIKSSEQNTIHLEYDRTKLASLAIAQHQIPSQTFQTVMGMFWQVILYFKDGTPIVIDEKSSSHQALTKAKQIAFKLEIPIHFMNSEGNNHYAARNLPIEKQQPSHSIKVTRQGQKWHIYSKWRWGYTWQLLKQIFDKLGFILFVLIITSFMIKLGGILHSFIASYLGWGTETIALSIPKIINWFNPNLEQRGYFEFIIAITVIFIQGVIISQTKHIYVDESWLTYRVSNHRKRNIQANEIEGILLITFPEPMVLIITHQSTIGIQKLPTPQAYPELLLKTEQALQSFQKKPSE